MIESFKPKLQFSLFNVLLVFFICFTLILGVATWNIQHSCQPMIGSSECIKLAKSELPDSPELYTLDQPVIELPNSPEDSPELYTLDQPVIELPNSPEESPELYTLDQPVIEPSKEESIGKKILPDAVGVMAGSATITGLAIAQAPVLAVVAAGIGVWFVVRTTIKIINGS